MVPVILRLLLLFSTVFAISAEMDESILKTRFFVLTVGRDAINKGIKNQMLSKMRVAK